MSTLTFHTQNVIDACLGALSWYAVGFAMAYGEGSGSSNVFIGTKVRRHYVGLAAYRLQLWVAVIT